MGVGPSHDGPLATGPRGASLGVPLARMGVRCQWPRAAQFYGAILSGQRVALVNTPPPAVSGRPAEAPCVCEMASSLGIKKEQPPPPRARRLALVLQSHAALVRCAPPPTGRRVKEGARIARAALRGEGRQTKRHDEAAPPARTRTRPRIRLERAGRADSGVARARTSRRLALRLGDAAPARAAKDDTREGRSDSYHARGAPARLLRQEPPDRSTAHERTRDGAELRVKRRRRANTTTRTECVESTTPYLHREHGQRSCAGHAPREHRAAPERVREHTSSRRSWSAEDAERVKQDGWNRGTRRMETTRDGRGPGRRVSIEAGRVVAI